MLYKVKSDLFDNVWNVFLVYVQDIYKEVFNSVWE